MFSHYGVSLWSPGNINPGLRRKELGFAIFRHTDLYFILQVLQVGPTNLHAQRSALIRLNQVGRFGSCHRLKYPFIIQKSKKQIPENRKRQDMFDKTLDEEMGLADLQRQAKTAVSSSPSHLSSQWEHWDNQQNLPENHYLGKDHPPSFLWFRNYSWVLVSHRLSR